MHILNSTCLKPLACLTMQSTLRAWLIADDDRTWHVATAKLSCYRAWSRGLILSGLILIAWLRNQQNNQKNGSNKAWWSPVIAAVIVQHAFTILTYKFADLSFHHQVHPRKAWPELWKQPHVICCTLSCFQAKPLIWTKCCAEKPCPILVPQKSESDTDKAEQCYSCMVLPAACQSLTQRIQTAERWRHNSFAIMCKRHYEHLGCRTCPKYLITAQEMVVSTIKALLLEAGRGNAVCRCKKRISHERCRRVNTEHANNPEQASWNGSKAQSWLCQKSVVEDSKLDLPLPLK